MGWDWTGIEAWSKGKSMSGCACDWKRSKEKQKQLEGLQRKSEKNSNFWWELDREPDERGTQKRKTHEEKEKAKAARQHEVLAEEQDERAEH